MHECSLFDRCDCSRSQKQEEIHRRQGGEDKWQMKTEKSQLSRVVRAASALRSLNGSDVTALRSLSTMPAVLPRRKPSPARSPGPAVGPSLRRLTLATRAPWRVCSIVQRRPSAAWTCWLTTPV